MLAAILLSTPMRGDADGAMSVHDTMLRAICQRWERARDYARQRSFTDTYYAAYYHYFYANIIIITFAERRHYADERERTLPALHCYARRQATLSPLPLS